MVFEQEVVLNRKLNEKFILITLKSKNPKFSFKTGQFTSIKIKKNILRCYSFASLPENLPFWKIFVDLTPGGPGTVFLKNLKKGDLIKTLDPRGHFLLMKKYKKYIFAATGCGIAPFLAMIKALIRTKDKKIFLFWGLRYKKDIVLTKLLQSYTKLNSNFSFEVILSKPEGKWQGKSGYLQNFIIDKIDQVGQKDMAIYLSGSREFIVQSIQLLKQKKFPIKKIYTELCY